MDIQELIDSLMLIEDKTKKVLIQIESGRSCFSTCDDVGIDEPDDESFIVICGEESSFE